MNATNHDHPAVEALARQLAQLDDGEPWPSNDELGGIYDVIEDSLAALRDRSL